MAGRRRRKGRGGGCKITIIFFLKGGGRLGLLSLRGCREGGEGSNDGRNEEEEGPQGRGVGWLLLLCLCKRGRAKGGIIIITWLLRRRRRRQRWREGGGGRAAGGGCKITIIFFLKGMGRLGLLSLRGWREGGEGSNDGRNEEEEGLQGRGVGWLLLLLRGCREGPGGGARGGGGITIIIFLQEGGGRRVSLLLLLLHGC